VFLTEQRLIHDRAVLFGGLGGPADRPVRRLPLRAVNQPASVPIAVAAVSALPKESALSPTDGWLSPESPQATAHRETSAGGLIFHGAERERASRPAP